MQDNHYVNFGALVSEVSELEHFIWDSLQSQSGGIGPQNVFCYSLTNLPHKWNCGNDFYHHMCLHQSCKFTLHQQPYSFQYD